MSLVPISFGAENNPPLVLIHDISGSPFAYLPFGLNALLSQYTIYGLSSLSPCSSTAKGFGYPSITAWAEAYATIIESELSEELQVDERVVVGGWSLGGILAAEIARIFARRPAMSKIRVLGLILLDTYAPWHELVHTGPQGLEVGGMRVESGYFTPDELVRIGDVLSDTKRDMWGMDRIGCSAWLITPNIVGANGLEEWFPDDRRVRRIGQGKEGCDHFSMMDAKGEWINQVIAEVSSVLKEIKENKQ
ncbi:Alpha/Beta hydrolase protein [Mycena alexandri]|uniref:Alpha/Beta hydrolase protein n=1 Tax=Mycena alexandri TaxID=1745969 RepID=A0AAD6TIU5_9AGAR|nr:Alpha/Beta hydrolase protein [Mycena alexandri]